MECHPWFEVSNRRKIRFRNVQIKVLLVFEQGRPLLVLTSFDQFWPVLTSFDNCWPVSTSNDKFWLVSIQDKIVYGITQLWLSTFFRGGSLLLPTSLISVFSEIFRWFDSSIISWEKYQQQWQNKLRFQSQQSRWGFWKKTPRPIFYFKHQRQWRHDSWWFWRCG